MLEEKQTGGSTVDEKAEAAGAQVIRGRNRIGQFSAMHQKYAIVDGVRVLTGATNWTNAGTRTNEEDLLVVEGAEFAMKYRKNFADLMSVYGGLDITNDSDGLRNEKAPVLFNPVHAGTQLGDRVVVVGSDPARGAWDPTKGIDASTHKDLFPSWSAAARLPAGVRVEYKFVTLRPNGEVTWEPGANRVIEIAPTGRAVVTSGTYGDTSKNWTPRDPR